MKLLLENYQQGYIYVLYYTDDTHYQILTYTYSNYNNPTLLYNNEVVITKGADYKVAITVGGENFNDYSGDVIISVFEYFQFNYSAKTNHEPILNGKVALIKDSLASSATFEDFQNQIVVEKALDGITSTITFNDVKIGNYSVVVYTDEPHFEMAQLGYFQYSSSYFFVGQDKTIEKDAIVNAVNIRQIVFNQSFYVYNYTYDSNNNYVQQGIQGISIFVLQEDTYDNLDYSYRTNKSIIKKFALNSGVTDENGLLSLSVDGYKNNQVIYFNEAGEYMSSRTIFVTDESSQISYNTY